MKLTLAWLKEHLDTTASLDEIVAKLPAIGLEVESVEDRAAALAPFIVGSVVECHHHPDADKLHVCLVDTGTDKVQVVCGAPNARAGLKSVFARAGLTIPGTGLELKAAAVRGQMSNGMLCSAREMGLGDDHSGILELPADAPVGQPFAPVLGLDDPVLDIAITANRGDCLGIRGIARDLAAAGLGRLKPRVIEPVPVAFPNPLRLTLRFPPDQAHACPMFAARVIRGVKNGESPRWLQDRLVAVGLRPISALVDVTNFMTLDVSRPLHVFDADGLAGELTVRFAEDGETLRALNGKDYSFDPSMTVIADDDSVLSLAGIIGGEPSGCTAETTTVIVESALWDTLRTAATGRKLGLQTDARYRFERGVDPAAVVEGLEAATRMILDFCGGEASEVVVAGAEPNWRRHYALRPERIHGLGGLDLPLEQATKILDDLGFTHKPEDGNLIVEAPSWRPDIQGEADLVEEVIRIAGLDRIEAVPLPPLTALPQPALSPPQRRALDARRYLAERGLMEAVTYSFMPGALAARFGGDHPALALANPISADLDRMRPSILPNLIQAARRNADRGFADLALYEVGPQYGDDTPTGQALVAAGVRAGLSGPRHWAAAPRAVDAFDVKADALGLIAALGLATENLQVTADAPAWYHPGRSGTLRLGPKTVLGWFGELHPGVLKALDAAAPMAAFEVLLDAVPMARAKAGHARPLLKPSPFQAVERDFAFVVGAGVSADAIVRAAKSADRNLIERVSVFDVYAGKGIAPGQKSVAISVRLQPTAGTLTDAEIEGAGKRIVAAVAKATGATLRG